MTTSPPAPYRVLARAYRPTRLSELIGQEALARTLTNAFTTGRIAHAFVLSGIRGVGKTTTARIIARGLNCTGPDGEGGPTPEPCGTCPSCRSIEQDRSLDVIEMDAATRTGIDDVRELVEAVAYAPSASRYKVYIVDEVHMLSQQAFNGLLKTLEEPPAHAKFVFATTELRKIPITLLSRCQRFDLRRVEAAVLVANLERICAREGVTAESDALGLIARAAEGSVRDSLSLLDQAIVLADQRIDALLVRDMLGLVDRDRLMALWEAVAAGDTAAVIDRFAAIHALGGEPSALINDLLTLTHELSRLRAGTPVADADERMRQAAETGLPVLARAWQMLLRGVEEVRTAPDAAAAAEMLLLRLACVADLPSPAELARLAQGGGALPPSRAAAAPSRPAAPARPMSTAQAAPATEAAPAATAPPEPQPVAPVRDFADLVARIDTSGDRFLAAWLHGQARVIRFEPGRIELEQGGFMPPDLPGRLAEATQALTGRRWMVALGRGQGAPSLAEIAAGRRSARLAELHDDPQIRQVLEAFPGAELVDVRAVDAPAGPDAGGVVAAAAPGIPPFDGSPREGNQVG